MKVNLKMKMLKFLGLVPSNPSIPFCGRVGQNPYCKNSNVWLTIYTLGEFGCLGKSGRILKKPCQFLKWFPLHQNWPPVEKKLYKLFDWEEPPPEISLPLSQQKRGVTL